MVAKLRANKPHFIHGDELMRTKREIDIWDNRLNVIKKSNADFKSRINNKVFLVVAGGLEKKDDKNIHTNHWLFKNYTIFCCCYCVCHTLFVHVSYYPFKHPSWKSTFNLCCILFHLKICFFLCCVCSCQCCRHHYRCCCCFSLLPFDIYLNFQLFFSFVRLTKIYIWMN